ncbi:restriction endonuclease subunit S [uncultured Amphritea sp.]|uniref:restriction endonuclease subunit S n=1 Tax=uncultured Amphritea sp. TaxID=981605 RepID=UPI002620C269|nr:restriction endonuclease subunit S [uncultured Amphritea sp.]
MLVQLSDIAEIKLGQTFRGKAEASDNASGIKLVQIRDIHEGTLESSSLSFANIDKEKLKVRVIDNDLLLPLRGSRYEMCIFKSMTGDVVTTTNQVAIIRSVSNKVNLEYLLWYFNSTLGRAKLASLNTGTTVPKINSAQLTSFQFPLPDTSTQDAIVELYRNWNKQKFILSEMLINGEMLVESACRSILDKSGDSNGEN